MSVPDGETWFPFWVQGHEDGAGTSATLTAEAPGFSTGTSTVQVRLTVYDIQGLSASTTTFTADDAFLVRVGAAVSGADLRMQIEQAVRAGAASLAVTLTISESTVGQLTTLDGSGQTATLTIAPGQARSPGTVAGGGVAFDPLGHGTTTVAASIPELTAASGATQSVQVDAPRLTLPATVVGAGLQSGPC